MTPRLFLLAFAFLAACSHRAGTGSVLDRAGEIRRQADRAFADDCRVKVTVATGEGNKDVAAPCGLVKAIGQPVRASDLLTLFRDRIKTNRSGNPGPMSGDVEGLIYFGGDLLAEAQVEESIPVFAELLHDPDPKNCSSAAIFLLAMGNKNETLRNEIEKVPFPYNAVVDQKVPAWARVVR
jgi:hypothetical protein